MNGAVKKVFSGSAPDGLDAVEDGVAEGLDGRLSGVIDVRADLKRSGAGGKVEGYLDPKGPEAVWFGGNHAEWALLLVAGGFREADFPRGFFGIARWQAEEVLAGERLEAERVFLGALARSPKSLPAQLRASSDVLESSLGALAGTLVSWVAGCFLYRLETFGEEGYTSATGEPTGRLTLRGVDQETLDRLRALGYVR